MKTETKEKLEEARQKNVDTVVSREEYIDYYRYLCWVTNGDEANVKSGDGLYYQGVKIICA